MSMINCINDCYTRTADGLARWLGPVTLLSMRLWVAWAFWQAGLVKIADPEGTRYLFESMYHVPLLPPDFAAGLGTWIELIVPWFVGLGLFGRPFALFLFVYNIIAFTSFPALWPHGFWHSLFNTTDFADHKVWGLMLMAVIAWGPGALSVDKLIGITWRRWRGASGALQLG
ncbi:DoxX family protein [Rhodanobacter sp. Si-c]|uniref:DoxX family protein n=1 Tax=Rhodanobacter lycopersici TaxID=3162487 RepID=A0ABV3QG61_9GAMM